MRTDTVVLVDDRAQALRLANRVWRQVGVRRPDREAMLEELDGELRAAHGYGGTVDEVLGPDRSDALREWAHARDASGRSLRLYVVIPAALGGLLAGFAAVLLLLIWATVAQNIELPIPVLLTLYGTSAAISLLMAGLGAWVALRVSHDPKANATARWLALTLPIGGLVALGAGVATAGAFQFRQPEISFPTTVLVVLAVMALAVAVARYGATHANLRSTGDLPVHIHRQLEDDEDQRTHLRQARRP